MKKSRLDTSAIPKIEAKKIAEKFRWDLNTASVSEQLRQAIVAAPGYYEATH